MIKQPMLAGKADLSKLKYPVMISPKLDGIRALIVPDASGRYVVMSRSMKPIPNRHVQAALGHEIFSGLDGELIVGDPTAPDVFRESTSGVMSINGEPDFTYWVFDRWDINDVYDNRLCALKFGHNHPHVKVVMQMVIKNETDLAHYEERILEMGFEGLIIRSIHGYYKQGRSTTNEGILLKLKRWEDSEAEIIGFEEEMENQNVAFTNEVGKTARSTAQENLVGKNRLGNFLVRDIKTGVEFSLGSGIDHTTRAAVWTDRDSYFGKLVKYKHFPIGAKDKPRQPIFLGFRHKEDL